MLTHLRHKGMFNAADDPVKMVFHPEFVSVTAPTISLDYEQFVRGCHLGLFPSYYEPWGYTPMECIALGVPAATTDLSGFGAYVQRHVPDHDNRGILVLDRRARSFDQTCDALVDYLVAFCRLNRRQRIEMRNNVERLGELFDWSNLIKHYDEAHNLALERVARSGSGRSTCGLCNGRVGRSSASPPPVPVTAVTKKDRARSGRLNRAATGPRPVPFGG